MTKRAFIESFILHIVLLLLASMSFLKDTQGPLDRAIFVEIKDEKPYGISKDKSKGHYPSGNEEVKSNLEKTEEVIQNKGNEGKNEENTLSGDVFNQKEYGDATVGGGSDSKDSGSSNTAFLGGQSEGTGGGSGGRLPYASGDEYSSIKSDIERHIKYPEVARRRGLEGTVFVGFIIDQMGMPTEIKIIKSSRYEVLDNEVIKIIKRASPYRVRNIQVEVPISFRLKD